MRGAKLKEYLLQIADKVTENTSLEEVFNQLALLNDIEESEDQELKGQVISHQEVIHRSQTWFN